MNSESLVDSEPLGKWNGGERGRQREEQMKQLQQLSERCERGGQRFPQGFNQIQLCSRLRFWGRWLAV
ncbi:hypothetical protein L596_006470 [Steinernema carpocapsae]|uniref:Uncharacterized protein n=1 Tax=Steinernema carpocapsae TaxID=34508 RepID=A0A4U8V4I3_STECR|nr:hypothetical protein L596_006470 [Steinernema carpocapsae]